MKKNTYAAIIIASAIIWALVIIGCSLKLKGTSCYEEINLILVGGVLSHIFLFGALIKPLLLNKK
jgi:hypothetical protein